MAAIGLTVHHHHLLGKNEGPLGSGMEDLIPGFHLDHRLQLTLQIGAVLMMDQDLNDQNSGIVTVTVLYLGVGRAPVEFLVAQEMSILTYPAMVRNQAGGRIVPGTIAGDGMIEMNAATTATGTG